MIQGPPLLWRIGQCVLGVALILALGALGVRISVAIALGVALSFLVVDIPWRLGLYRRR